MGIAINFGLWALILAFVGTLIIRNTASTIPRVIGTLFYVGAIILFIIMIVKLKA